MPEVRTIDKEKATKYVCMLPALTPREQIIVLLLLLSTENGAKCLNEALSECRGNYLLVFNLVKLLEWQKT